MKNLLILVQILSGVNEGFTFTSSLNKKKTNEKYNEPVIMVGNLRSD